MILQKHTLKLKRSMIIQLKFVPGFSLNEIKIDGPSVIDIKKLGRKRGKNTLVKNPKK